MICLEAQMKVIRNILFGVGSLIFALCAAAPLAVAVDKDDDLKPEDNEKIAFTGTESSEKSAEIESKFPTQAKEVREFIIQHVEHAQKHELDNYMADFMAERMRYPDLERDYAKRAMALKDLKLELLAMEFVQLNATTATVHTRQLSSYTNDNGQKIVDDAIISYRLIKNGDVWKIAFTERRRLVAEQ